MTDVDWANNTEVSAIERGDLRLSEAFDARDDGRVDESKRKVGILLDKCAGARDLGGVGNVHLETCSLDIAHQAREPAVPWSQLILDLNQRAHRDDANFRGGIDELAAAVMIGVATVDERDQRAGVKNQRQASGS